ncbi:MAG TPA: helix-turn-helix transcriptional regulator [Candidatus Saccharimonadia bacterium]|nr:helix-turn-helix transcriptional regulator [Candidatus Saccharimonadia bacterium]
MSVNSRKAIAQRLYDARKYSGLTQVALAKKAGVNDNYYARVERGEVSPTLEKFEKIVKALDTKSSKIIDF